MQSQFEKNLKKLPSIEAIKVLEVKQVGSSTVLSSIENKPGKSGSLAVYHYLYKKFGTLTIEAAEQGLILFGEHTATAKLMPGSHPNIDFLIAVISRRKALEFNIVLK